MKCGCLRRGTGNQHSRHQEKKRPWKGHAELSPVTRRDVCPPGAAFLPELPIQLPQVRSPESTAPHRLPSLFCTSPKKAATPFVTHLPQGCMIWERQNLSGDVIQTHRELENLDKLSSSQQPFWFLSLLPPSSAQISLHGDSRCVQLVSDKPKATIRPAGDPRGVMVGEPASWMGFLFTHLSGQGKAMGLKVTQASLKPWCEPPSPAGCCHPSSISTVGTLGPKTPVQDLPEPKTLGQAEVEVCQWSPSQL